MKTLKHVLFALLVLATLLSSAPAEAQVDPNCFEFRLVNWLNHMAMGPMPGETCVNAGPMLALCKRPKGTCPPPPEDKCDDCNQAGRPINLATGNTFIEQTDLRVPGLGGGLSLTRTWNSIAAPSISTVTINGAPTGIAPGMFGMNWRSTYEERVFLHSDSYMKYVQGDGSVWSFGSLQCAAPANSGATIANDGTNTWTITFKNGEKRVFSYASGSLISIIDRNGNTTQLSYDGTNRLTTVTDAASRHLYFNYPNASSRLVTSVTSDVGLSLAYTYDGNDRLTQVTQIDGTPLNFEYNSQALITAVTAVVVTDSLGHETYYTSGMVGGQWLASNSEGSGCSSCSVRGTISRTHDLNGNMLTITDELSRTKTYTFDGVGNMLTEAIPLNTSTTATTTYTYNSFGQVLTATDAIGKTTTNTYDVKGNLLTVTTPAPDASTPASVTEFEYNTLGQLIEITDPLNR